MALLSYKVAHKDRKTTGDKAEQRAARFLKSKHHRILARNFHCRFGEIDLITCDPQTCIVFVEVRYRSESQFASAAESVTLRKQNRLRRSAQSFLAKHPTLAHLPCRFDVITLEQPTNSRKITIQWIQNAFY